jgi:hypothetical protein
MIERVKAFVKEVVPFIFNSRLSKTFDRVKYFGFRVHIFEWFTEKNRFGGKVNKFGLIEDERAFVATKPGPVDCV